MDEDWSRVGLPRPHAARWFALALRVERRAIQGFWRQWRERVTGWSCTLLTHTHQSYTVQICSPCDGWDSVCFGHLMHTCVQAAVFLYTTHNIRIVRSSTMLAA